MWEFFAMVFRYACLTLAVILAAGILISGWPVSWWWVVCLVLAPYLLGFLLIILAGILITASAFFNKRT